MGIGTQGKRERGKGMRRAMRSYPIPPFPLPRLLLPLFSLFREQSIATANTAMLGFDRFFLSSETR